VAELQMKKSFHEMNKDGFESGQGITFSEKVCEVKQCNENMMIASHTFKGYVFL
jgi:hypothetical protein